MLKKYLSEFITKYKKMSVVTKAALWFTFATVCKKEYHFLRYQSLQGLCQPNSTEFLVFICHGLVY